MLDNTLLKMTIYSAIVSHFVRLGRGLHPIFIFIFTAVLLFRLKPKITKGLASNIALYKLLYAFLSNSIP